MDESLISNVIASLTAAATSKLVIGLATTSLLCLLLPSCFYLWRLATKGFPVNCWFCGGDTRVPFGNRNCFDCPHCDQYNGFDADGNYNKDIPAMRHSAMNLHRSNSAQSASSIASPPGNNSSSSVQLCDNCNRNQALKVAQLAEFEPSCPAMEDAELAALRTRLERAYALCPRCRSNRRATLQAQDIRLLPGLLEWQRSRVRARSAAGSANNSAKLNYWLRVFSACLAAMGAASAVSARAARVLCLPAACCLLLACLARRPLCFGWRFFINSAFLGGDLWQGPVFFAGVDPLRSNLIGWIGEALARLINAAAELGVVGLAVPSKEVVAMSATTIATYLLPLLLGVAHLIAFWLRWRQFQSRPNNSLVTVVNVNTNNNNTKARLRNLNSNNSNHCGSNSDSDDSSFAADDVDNNVDSASTIFASWNQLHQRHQQQQHQQHHREVKRPASLPPDWSATTGSNIRPIRSFNYFQPGRLTPAQSLLSPMPPTPVSMQRRQQPPAPPSTPLLLTAGTPGPALVGGGNKRVGRLSPPGGNVPLGRGVPSPMDVDDEFCGQQEQLLLLQANGGCDVAGGGDSAYASQRASIADMPLTYGAASSAESARSRPSNNNSSRSRLSQVLIGCCVGINFSLMLHCLLLPAGRAALTAVASGDNWSDSFGRLWMLITG